MDIPEYLDRDANKEWNRAVKILQDIGLLTEIDMAVLAMYCQSYSEWKRATKKMLEYGPEFVLWCEITKEAYGRMVKIANLLGLLPSGRKGIN